MPVSAAVYQSYAVEIRRIYAEAERVMLYKVARRLERGIELDGWAERKLAEVAALNGDLRGLIAELQRTAPDIAQAIEQAYDGGVKAAVADLKRARLEVLQESLPATRGVAVQTLAARTVQALSSTHLQILRTADDVYRSTIAEASAQATVGTMTRRQAAQYALNRFADQGVKGFVDKAGRAWDLTTYAEMATRTTTGQAAVEGHLRMLEANGKDLVIVHASADACESCAAYNGAILSLTGSTAGYTTLATATSDSHLQGVNCGCSLSAYIPGMTREMEPVDPDVRAKMYQARQQQRYLERGVRRWKNRDAVALDDDAKAIAKAHISAYQAKLRDLTAESGRRRDYARESITRAR